MASNGEKKRNCHRCQRRRWSEDGRERKLLQNEKEVQYDYADICKGQRRKGKGRE